MAISINIRHSPEAKPTMGINLFILIRLFLTMTH